MIEKIPVTHYSSVTRKNSKVQPITNAFLIADIHLGWNMGSDEWRENAHEYFYNYFIPLIEKEKDEGSIILCLGDVFHDRKTTNIAINNLAIDVFEKLAEILPVYIINGNHDMYKKSHNDITSLRSFHNISNLTIFKDVTDWTIGSNNDNWSKHLLMIPYQDDTQKETNIINQNTHSDYIFMHTEIKNLSYDNGLSITLGVDTSSVKGKLFAGHIHKRQEKGDLVYVGSPYQLKRSEMGNQKGIYRLYFNTGDVKFYENDVSPEFVRLTYDEILLMNETELKAKIQHNYVDIMIKTEQKDDVKIGELSEQLSKYKPRHIEIKEIRNNYEWELKEEKDTYTEKSILEIVDELIDGMECPEEQKNKLKYMNSQFHQTIEIEA